MQKGVYDQSTKSFVAKVKNFKLGAGFDKGVAHGPLIHKRAASKAHGHVQVAVLRGAIVLVGGKKATLGPSFYEPTVLMNINKEMLIASKTFGPVAGLFAFGTEKEVIDLAKQAEVGISRYIFSGKRELHISSR